MGVFGEGLDVVVNPQLLVNDERVPVIAKLLEQSLGIVDSDWLAVVRLNPQPVRESLRRQEALAITMLFLLSH